MNSFKKCLLGKSREMQSVSSADGRHDIPLPDARMHPSLSSIACFLSVPVFHLTMLE
jgi:hypothetical protein